MYHCDCDFTYRKKWVVKDSVQVFTLCDCDNIASPYTVRWKQNKKKSHSVNGPLV